MSEVTPRDREETPPSENTEAGNTEGSQEQG